MDRQDYNKIFILGSPGIGDLVLLMPTLYALRENLPDTDIRLVTSRGQLPLAKTLEGKVVTSLVQRSDHNDFRDIIKLVADVRHYRPNVFAELSGSNNPAVIGYLSFVSRAIHPPAELSRPVNRALQGERIDYGESHHRVDMNLQLLKSLGIRNGNVSFEFNVPDENLDRAEYLIKQYGLRQRPLVGVIPSSAHHWKNWPVKSVYDAIDAITRELGFDVAVLGHEKTFPATGKKVVDLRGQGDLLTDAYLLRYAGVFDVVIGVDTGMMHIAGSVSSGQNGSYGRINGNRTVSLFGPTNPEMYRPYDPTGNFNLVVRSGQGISRTNYNGFANDRFKTPYMNQISLNEVTNKLKRHLHFPQRVAAYQ